MLRKAPVPFFSVLFQSRPLLVRLRRLIFLLLVSVFLNIIVFWLGEFNNFGRLSLSDLGLRRFDFVCFFGLSLRLFLGFVTIVQHPLPWGMCPHQGLGGSISIRYVTVLAFSRVEVAVFTIGAVQPRSVFICTVMVL